MEKIYPEYKDRCKLIKTSPEKVSFLLKYSQSLNIVKHKKFTFENNLN